MEAYYFTFQSVTQAQSGIAVLQRHGIPAKLVRAQRIISASGCGYAAELRVTDVYGAAFILQNAGVVLQKIFRITAGGVAGEVFL